MRGIKPAIFPVLPRSHAGLDFPRNEPLPRGEFVSRLAGVSINFHLAGKFARLLPEYIPDISRDPAAAGGSLAISTLFTRLFASKFLRRASPRIALPGKGRGTDPPPSVARVEDTSEGNASRAGVGHAETGLALDGKNGGDVTAVAGDSGRVVEGPSEGVFARWFPAGWNSWMHVSLTRYKIVVRRAQLCKPRRNFIGRRRRFLTRWTSRDWQLSPRLSWSLGLSLLLSPAGA